MPCETCGITVVSGWGYIEGFNDWCEHAKAMRYCDSCSTSWWAERMEPDWDVGGCGWKDCPNCEACLKDEQEGA